MTAASSIFLFQSFKHSNYYKLNTKAQCENNTQNKRLQRYPMKKLTTGLLVAISFIEAPFTHTLESLDLSDTCITSAGVKLLTLPNVFASLKRLDLSGNRQIQDASTDMLLTAPFAGKLKFLKFSELRRTRAAKQRLLNSLLARKIEV